MNYELIPEIGSSWMGSYEVLESMLKFFARYDIKTVKFQAYDYNFISRHVFDFPHVENGRVTAKNVSKIFHLCEDYGLEFFCTPCYLRAVSFLNPYVKRWKVRYKDQDNYELRKLLLETQKEIWISSDTIIGGYNRLYCLGHKPIEFQEIEFDKMLYFQGYSNHCMDPRAILKAIDIGMKMIEVHVTPNKNFKLIDNAYSYDLKQFESLMDELKCLV